MKPRSVYVLGGAGTGKTFFVASVLRDLEVELGPLTDYSSLHHKGRSVKFQGHPFEDGVYLGILGDPKNPGTDALDRICSPAGAAWLHFAHLPGRIIGEGATLTTTTFLNALVERTELLAFHLTADPMVTDLRLLARGSNQKPSFINNTRTRALNAAKRLREEVPVVEVETDVDDSFQSGLLHATTWLEEERTS